MPASDIVIKGAREHNLRDIEVVLPRNKLICLTGVSGSGKSSLAFDTLYAEGQRRYVESLSSFARQFLGQMPKPDVDFISGLSPSISISQKSSGQNPRSTVGTITEIYDYLRVLYARTGQGHCPNCSRPDHGSKPRADHRANHGARPRDGVSRPRTADSRTKGGISRPVRRSAQARLRAARVDGRVVQLTDDLQLDRQMRHNIEVVIDRLTAGDSIRPRLAEAVELALRLGEGNLIIAIDAGRATCAATSRGGNAPDNADEAASQPAATDITLSAHYACTHCGLSFESPSPQLFSFNSPQGMCRECDGLGEIYGFDEEQLIPEPAKSFKARLH